MSKNPRRAPSAAERRLVEAGRDLVPRVGLAGLTVRAVAARARVNPGLFHYHFKDRGAFCRRVLEEIYGGFFRELETVIARQPGGSCAERLRRVLVAIARFERDHRAFTMSVMRDVLNGEREAGAYLRRVFPSHLRLLHELIRDCQRAGAIRRMPVPAVVTILVAASSGPAMSIGFMERATADVKPAAVLTATLAKVVLNDEALEERVDVALRGLGPDGAAA